MPSWLTRNFGLKLLSLLLAVVLWLYVDGVLRGKPLIPRGNTGIPWAAKIVPIVPVIEGQPLPGFRIRKDKVSVKPDRVVVLAPEEGLRGITKLTTQPVSVIGANRSVIKWVSLRTEKGASLPLEEGVEVNIPIEASGP